MKAVGFDNTTLSVLLNPACRIPIDPVTSKPVTQAKQRVELLVQTLAKMRQRIILPTPVIGELLTAIGPSAQQYIDIVARSRVFEIAAFDEKAAIELAFLNREVFAEQDNARSEPYQKVKIDRQIIAVLKSRNAEVIYTDDNGQYNRALLCGIKPARLHELALPPEDKQLRLALEPHEDLPQVADEA